MDNVWVKDYCEAHSLEIIDGVQISYLVNGDNIVAEFRNTDKTITFFDKSKKASLPLTIRKGDLMLYMLENQKAH